MSNNSFSVSSILGVSSTPKTNPILELRKLQKQIASSSALSTNDRATRTRLQAERLGVLERSSIFTSLQSEVGTLKRLAERLSATRLIEENPFEKTKETGPSIFSSNTGAVSASITGEVSTTTFSLGVDQLATKASLSGNAIAQTTVLTEEVERLGRGFRVDALLDSSGQARTNSVLKLGEDGGFQTGDKVRLSGLGESGDFFVRAGGDNNVQLFRTAEQAGNSQSNDGLLIFRDGQDLGNVSLSKLSIQQETVETLGDPQFAKKIRDDREIQTFRKNGFETGDKVRVSGDLQGEFFVRAKNDTKFELFRTREQALAGGSSGRITFEGNDNDDDDSSGINLRFQKVGTTTRETEVAGPRVSVNGVGKDESNPLTTVRTRGANGFQTGDEVRLNGNLPGVRGETFFARRLNENSFELFRTAEQARSGGNDGRVVFNADSFQDGLEIAKVNRSIETVTEQVEVLGREFSVNRLLDANGQQRQTAILQLGENNGLRTGDKVQVSGDLPGVEGDKFFARVGDNNQVELFRTAEQARDFRSNEGRITFSSDQLRGDVSIAKLTTSSEQVETVGNAFFAKKIRNGNEIQTFGNNGFKTGDKVRVEGDFPGGGSEFFVRRNSGSKFELFGTEEQARNTRSNAGRIEFQSNDIPDGGLSFAKVTTTTREVERAGDPVSVTGLKQDQSTPLTIVQTNRDNDFRTGDAVRARGNLPGVEGETFFVRRLGEDAFELFRTAEQARGRGNEGRIEFGSDQLPQGLSFAKVTTETRDVQVAVDLTGKVGQSNLPGLSLPEGGATIRINGTDIEISGDQTFRSVLKTINQSDAGVTATFNAETRQFSLTSKDTGEGAITIEDVRGNLGAALGLVGGTSTAGQDAQFRVTKPGEDAQTFTSSSNTIDGSTFGVSGTQFELKSITSQTTTTTVPGESVFEATGQAGISRIFRDKIRTEGRNGIQTGDAIQLSGRLPEGISTDGTFFARRLNAREFALYGTKEQAEAGGREGRVTFAVPDGGRRSSGGGSIDVGGRATVTIGRITTTPDTTTTTVTRNPVTVNVKAADKTETVITADPEAVKEAIKEFFNQFNKVQSILESSGGKELDELSTGLRRALSEVFGNSDIAGALGGSSKSNTFTLDEEKLSSGIDRGLDAVLDLFRGPNGAGFAARTASFLSSFTGSTGSLAREITRLDKSETDLTKKLGALADKEENNRTRLNESLASISSAIISIQGNQSFLKGLGGQDDKAEKTRTGTLGLNLSGQLAQIQDRLKRSGAGPAQDDFDLSKGISGIQDFLKSIQN